MTRKIGILLLVMIMLSVILFGCKSNVQSPFSKKSIVVAGSTSVQPLADDLAKAYMQKHPDVKIEVQGGGSAVGIKSAREGIADIGTSSRDLKPEEKGLNEFKIAIDGIAVVVNPQNPIKNLTLQQIRDIYSGKIKNWKDVGGKNAQIVVVTREEGSGTRGAFEELVMEGQSITDSAVVQSSNGAVKQSVSQDPNAIGYISLGIVDSTVKAVSIEGVDATEENVKNGKYKIQRPFLFLTKDKPAGLVKDFIDFALSGEGQAIVEKHHYIKVK
ncbi:phosphate ABC transporter substrate-binding protein [Caldicellulosiruptor morganii]|uniref:Phosphate-binding protein n=1 Tax=Caldicellulosiruptor morganii TaxID=1387555 RepID=A0ABY7BNH4_9FIRM|nr:phosphate ABC transporter substrate-binding protein [Caldicellulosiruptor morganii]WAM33081.1 phosphate ABC transporter substrate-binding protein [Caldicellulosiruptor morganii]